MATLYDDDVRTLAARVLRLTMPDVHDCPRCVQALAGDLRAAIARWLDAHRLDDREEHSC